MVEGLLDKLLKAHISRIPATVTAGIIKAVDEDKYTCTVEREDKPTLYDVRLNAVEYSGSRFAVIPDIDSYVLLCTIEGKTEDAYLLAYSKISKVVMIVGEAILEVTAVAIKASIGDSSLEVTSSHIKAALGASSIELTDVSVAIGGMIIMNGGSLGGVPSIGPLKNNIKSIKDYTESMKAAIATAFQQIPNGGAVASMNFNGSMAGKVIDIQEIANENVTQ